MSVVGIDFGTMNCVVSVVRRGIDIIDNEVSKRQTSSLVGFDESKRDIGEAARSSWKKNFRTTVAQPKRLLATNMDHIANEKPFLGACRFRRSEINNSPVVDITYKQNNYSFTPEQITAMLFTNLKQMTERKTGQNIADAVISVPGYYTDNQRRAVADAAAIAGINVIRIINDLTALALFYLYNNRNLDENESRNVLLVDMGAANTSCAIVEFKKNSFKVLASAYDGDLGGRNIDLAIAMHLLNKFQAKNGIDLRDYPRCWIRVLTCSENVKKTLNLGGDATVNETCIFEEYDMVDTITKQEYANILTPLVNRLHATVQKAIESSGVNVSQLYSAEWVGGGMRVHELQKNLSSAIGKPVENHMNAEEAISMGCALQCAFLSPRVYFSNKIVVGDAQDYGISISWESVNSDSNETKKPLQLVKSGYNLSRNKPVRLTLHRPPVPMRLTIYYDNPDQLPPGANPIIGRYTLPNIPDLDGKPEVDLRFKFKHDHSGITNLLKAELVETKEIEVEVPVENEPTKMDIDTNNSEKTDKPENQETKVDKDGDTKMEEPPKTVKKKKTETKYHTLEFVSETSGLSQEKIKEFRDLEEKFIAEDLYVFQLAQTKNDLESYIYNSRDKLQELWRDFTTTSEKGEFSQLLSETLNWFEQEDNQPLNIYQSKLSNLQNFGNRFNKRVYEYEEVPKAVNQLMFVLDTYKSKAASGDEAYAHIPKEKLESIPAECDRVYALIKEKLDIVVNKTDDPVLFSSDLIERATNLTKFCEDILNTPKPKPKPEPKPETKQDNNTNPAGSNPAGSNTNPESNLPTDTNTNVPNGNNAQDPPVDMETD